MSDGLSSLAKLLNACVKYPFTDIGARRKVARCTGRFTDEELGMIYRVVSRAYLALHEEYRRRGHDVDEKDRVKNEGADA